MHKRFEKYLPIYFVKSLYVCNSFICLYKRIIINISKYILESNVIFLPLHPIPVSFYTTVEDRIQRIPINFCEIYLLNCISRLIILAFAYTYLHNFSPRDRRRDRLRRLLGALVRSRYRLSIHGCRRSPDIATTRPRHAKSCEM